MHFRPLRALRELDRRLDELHAADRAAEEWARIELARSASRFSRRAKEVVDDTVGLSATLMRAGEVEEAGRLLEEAEFRVRSEEAALLETVNEVKAAGEIRRRRMSRLRIAKTFATTLLSGSMFVTSAFGVALARFAIEGGKQVERSIEAPGGAAPEVAPKRTFVEEVEVAGVKLSLTREELKRFKRLTAKADPEALRSFLEERLPKDLAERVQAALIAAVAPLDPYVPVEVEATAVEALEPVEVEAPEPRESEKPAPEPSEDPEPEPTSPAPEPEPSPTPTTGDEENKDPGSQAPLGLPWGDGGSL
jgi:hypothetical protein